ncbi:MAG: hypothetical protein WBQ61_25130 [Candidatus Acidiferrum sp.]
MILVVYVSNLLAHKVSGPEKGAPPAHFDMDYLRASGAAELLPKWSKLAETVMPVETKLVSY